MIDAKKIITSLLLSVALLACPAAMLAAKSEATYVDCMERTKHQRLICASGCGMIIQSCYDEGADEIDREINSMLSLMKEKGNPGCTSLATEYLHGALSMEKDIGEMADTQPGWFGAELKLHLAQQQLATIQFIRKNCP